MGLLDNFPGLTNAIQDQTGPAPDQVAGLAGSREVLDTGQTTTDAALPLNGPDRAEADPTGLDLDVLSYEFTDSQKAGIANIGVLPQASDSWTLTDIDVLSGSYGGDSFLGAGIGPDFGDTPILYATALYEPDQPVDVQLFGQPLLADIL